MNTGDKKAQLFTLDILLALVPLTIVIGMSGNAMAGVASQIQEYAYYYSMQRQVNDAADVLVKTPGEPPNWNSTSPSGGPNILGLAEYEESTETTNPNKLDEEKVGALNDTYKTCMPKLIGNVTYYNLSIKGLTNVSYLNYWENGSKASASNIFVAERIAALAIQHASAELEEISRLLSTACCTGGGPGWGPPKTFYMDFLVASGDKNKYDFWLVGERYDATTSKAWIKTQADVDENGITDCCWASQGNADYTVFPTSGVECSCPGDADECREDIPPNGELSRIRIDSKLTENTVNYVFLEIRGKPTTGTSYYVIRVPAGTCNALVAPELTEPQSVLVRLEVGK